MTVEHLRQREALGSVRFITDNARIEEGAEGRFLNRRAGEEIVRYIRGRRLNRIPVLVYTRDIERTNFVEQFLHAGSTARGTVVYKFMEGLASRKDINEAWAKFKAD